MKIPCVENISTCFTVYFASKWPRHPFAFTVYPRKPKPNKNTHAGYKKDSVLFIKMSLENTFKTTILKGEKASIGVGHFLENVVYHFPTREAFSLKL